MKTAEQKICAVCGLPLSEDEMKWVKKEHINFTCRFHRRAVADFDLGITRRKLGYIDGGLGSLTINLMIKEWKL